MIIQLEDISSIFAYILRGKCSLNLSKSSWLDGWCALKPSIMESRGATVPQHAHELNVGRRCVRIDRDSVDSILSSLGTHIRGISTGTYSRLRPQDSRFSGI